MELLIATMAGAVLLLIGFVFFVISLRSLIADDVSLRLREYVDAQTVQPERVSTALASRRAELAGSFVSRALVPGMKRLGQLLGSLAPARVQSQIARELTIAGNPLGLGPREFYGLRIAFILLGLWLDYRIIQQDFNQITALIALLIFYVTATLPNTWLKRLRRRRQDQIRKGLADALDMLSVCADAGLGFDQSLLRVSEYWKTPVGIEFGRVVSEMEMGLSRQAALRSLADRLDVNEVSSFVAVILQSDQLGMSIADTLHGQAEQMRIERRFRAQEQARKIPLKMLFPMLLLIFPAMFAVILGPIVPSIIEFFATVRGVGQ